MTPSSARRAEKTRMVEKTRKARHVELRALIHTELVELENLLRTTRTDLVDTHNPIGGMVMTKAARDAQSDMIRNERAARLKIVTDPDPTSRQWLSATAVGSGPVPAPGSVAAYSAAAEADMVVSHLIRVLNARLHEASVCLIPRNKFGYAYHLAGHLADLVDVTANTRLLTDAHRDLVDVTIKVREVVEGPDKVTPPNPQCPLCHRNTLVSHLHERPQTIECSRDIDDGTLHRCECTDSMCPCHGDPVKHRHRWANQDIRQLRKLRIVDSQWTWEALAGKQADYIEAITAETYPPVPRRPTMQQTEQIPQTHQLNIEWQDGFGAHTRVVCNAEPGAVCRQSYACFLTDQCDTIDGHREGCEKLLVDVDWCNVAENINADGVDECGTGKLTVPIESMWTADGFVWTIPTPTEGAHA